MMARSTRVRIDGDGCLEVVDPGLDSLDLLRSVDPGFRIGRSELPGFAEPRFLRTREIGCGAAAHELAEVPEEGLWDIHSEILQIPSSCRADRRGNDASLMDLKVELSRRLLTDCRLCAHRCGVDRIRGELGICQLGTEAAVAYAFVHIAEEPPINPSLLISLAGCGLRCQYCQQWELLNPECSGQLLDSSLWQRLPTDGARSISFIGGNPDESLCAILRFLASAPADWKLPVVWNCHGYGTPETVRLLEGVVDAYVPDLKYGSEDCALELSEAPGYQSAAMTAAEQMLAQDVPVIVRILVLPGHFGCCHRPALEALARMSNERLLVSVRDQYFPDWKITSGEMGRRVTRVEAELVREKADELGLKLVDRCGLTTQYVVGG